MTDTCLIKRAFQLFQIRIIPPVHTSHDIPCQFRFTGHQPDGIHRPFMTLRISPQPVMVVGKTVQTDGHGMQSGFQQALQAGSAQIKAIGHHPPRITALIQCQPYLFQILAYQRFTSRNDNIHLVWIYMWSNAVYYTQKICRRHIRNSCRTFTVTAAMLATDITPLRTLPEKLPQRMHGLLIFTHLTEHLQRQPLA